MDGPPPLELESMEGHNPLEALFDEVGLPWRETRAEAVRRFGVRRHFAYPWDIVAIDTASPLVDGLLGPISAHARDDYAPGVPITQFSAAASFGSDAWANIQRAARRLADRFGHAPIGQRYNTYRCEWRAGAASITLTAWPDELQTSRPPNPSHAREPRLATACHVGVSTGFRPTLIPDEARWIAGFVPVLRTGHRMPTSREITHCEAPIGLLEFSRAPTVPLDGLLGFAGRSTGGEALILCSDQLYLVRTGQLRGFRVLRLLPAKGGGGAMLEALCATGFAARPSKWLTVATASDTHDLDETGPHFASMFGKECELCAPFPDI